jgi:peptidoglycan/LPS O-acetylase OafA/YrhL
MISQSNSLKENHFIQLDALRAISVSMVIFSHWAGYHNNLWSDVFWFNGEVGVKLFFIISGFLITRILLEERYKSEQLQYSRQPILKNFYIRRFLRIFPVYYATIFIGIVLQHPDMLASWKWHVTYLSNFLFAIRGEYMGDVSHFWSLAVEEQFYILWPIVILFLPKRFLLPWISFSIFIAPIFRYVCMFILKQNDVTVSVLPVSSMDCLSAGALLAYLKSNYTDENVRRVALNILGKTSAVCAILFILFNSFTSVPDGYEWHAIFVSRLLLVPALLGIVIVFINGFKGIVGRMLESNILIYPGKISYGIYLFHFFIPGSTYWLFSQLNLSANPLVSLVINIFLLLALASISWYCFEAPINQLKNYFPYRNNKAISGDGAVDIQLRQL